MSKPSYSIEQFTQRNNGPVGQILQASLGFDLGIRPGVNVYEFFVKDGAGLVLDFRYQNMETKDGELVGVRYAAPGTLYTAFLIND